MKIPRDVSAESLIKKLSALGFVKTRQVGSQIRLTLVLPEKSEHNTIPDHDPLRVGTLSGILRLAAIQLQIPKEDLIKKIFD